MKKMIIAIAVGLVATLALWADAAEKTAGKPAAAAVATIGSRAITTDDVRTMLEKRSGRPATLEEKRQLLEEMVYNELFFAAATKGGYENDPEVIRAVKQIVVGKFLRDNLEQRQSQVQATEQELQSYYESHRSRFGTRAMVHAALIRIAVSPKTAEEKRAEFLQRAENARTEALTLEPGVPAFGSVAVNYSEDQDSRYRGGDIGWSPEGTGDDRWGKKVWDAIFALETPRQVSPVIQGDDGYYIVKLIEKKDATTKPFAEVKDGVRHLLLQEKKEKLEKDFIAQLKSRIPVTINFELLQSIAVPDGLPGGKPPQLPGR